MKEMEDHRHPGTKLEELMPILASSTADLRAAAEKGFEEAIGWLNTANHSRWRKPRDPVPLSTREANLAKFRSVLAEFRETKHFDLLEPFRGSFDSKGALKPEYVPTVHHNARDLFKCHVFTANLIAFSIALIGFLSFLLELERKNPKPRLQLPTAFTKKLVQSANEKDGGGNPLDMGANQLDSSGEDSTDTLVEGEAAEDKRKKEKKVRSYGDFFQLDDDRLADRSIAKDPDAGDPTNFLQRGGRGLASIWDVLTSAHGIFALKYGLVSVALWVPTVCHSSAYFV